MKTKKTVFKEINEIKRGMKNGREWILYKCVDIDNVSFSAFNKPPMLDTEVEINYEETQNGKYTNRTIVDKPRNKPQMIDEFKILTDKLDEILKVVYEIQSKDKPF